MKNTFILAALTALVASQDIGSLPTCSLTCLSTAIDGLGCGITDFACSCQKASELTPVVTPCVQSACPDPADQAKTLEVLAGICSAAGFPIDGAGPPSSSSPETVQPTPTPSQGSSSATPSHEASSATPSHGASSTPQPSASEEPEYSEYPTATDVSSAYPGSYLPLPTTPVAQLTTPAPTHATDDVPNLPSSYSDFVPLPSFTDSSVVSLPSPQPTSVPSPLPPYPSSVVSHVSTPQGTAAPSRTSSSLPEFTGAAAAAQVPVMAVGLLGLAAFVL
ncbi:hypothetical protein OPT61_g1668 [Boeremia exigua]|uniref:Uncharacterized protein n=1 Tax=Boeremia exigua TaxID=749465 RepID=A0ACC2IPG5_9PLEO|nr:hypothetical protein OPT61_g1668 [Boeremia exigua]